MGYFWGETERILNKEAVVFWGKRPIAEVNRADVLRLPDAIVDRGTPIAANRTHEALRKLFNWSVGRGIVSASPVAGIGKPSGEESRDRVLDARELAEVWKATAGLRYPTGPFMRLLILTAQRLNEVAKMNWENIDLDKALWRLPKETTKAGRIHDVPLSSAAVELLKGLPRFEGPFEFTTMSGAKPFNGFSKLKLAIDAKMKAVGDGFKFKPWRVHDQRRTAATYMAGGVGVPPHVLSAILNHTPGSTQGVTAIYNRFRYENERSEALEKRVDYVLSLAEPKSKLAVGWKK